MASWARMPECPAWVKGPCLPTHFHSQPALVRVEGAAELRPCQEPLRLRLAGTACLDALAQGKSPGRPVTLSRKDMPVFLLEVTSVPSTTFRGCLFWGRWSRCFYDLTACSSTYSRDCAQYPKGHVEPSELPIGWRGGVCCTVLPLGHLARLGWDPKMQSLVPSHGPRSWF